MKKTILYKFSLIVALFLATVGNAQEVRKYSNDFLNIGVGARALGLGKAVIATTDDGNSGYWNPAGLVNVNSKAQLNLMHAEYFAGIGNYDYGSVAMPVESGVLGFSIIRFGIDDIQNTIDLVDQNGEVDYSRITKFSAADYAFIASFAKKLNLEGLSFGANAKIIRRQIGDFASSWGFGLDAGLQYTKNNWKFGAVAKDVTTTFNAWTYTLDDRTLEVFRATGNDIPEDDLELTAPKLSVGAARKFIIKNDFSVTPEIDADMYFDGQRTTLVQSKHLNLDPSLGIEGGYKDFIFIRGGLGNYINANSDRVDNSVDFNFGVGLYLKDLFGLGSLSIDYALSDVGDELNTNVFSLRFDINNRTSSN